MASIASVGSPFPVDSDSGVPTTAAITTKNVGDLIVVWNWGQSAGTISSITDSNSRVTWSSTRVDGNSQSGYRYEMWWGTVKSVGSTTVTVNWSTAPSGFGEIIVDELTFPGVSSSTVWAVEAHGTLNTASGTVENYPSLTSGASAVTGRAYVGAVVVVSGASTAGSTSGFTYTVMPSGSGSVEAVDGSVAASTAYQPTATQTSSGACAAVAGIFAASGGGPTTVNGTAATTVPGPAASAAGVTTVFGSTSTTVPAPAATAAGTAVALGSAAVTIPAPTATAAGVTVVTGAATVTVPGPVAAAAALARAGAATATIPGPTATAAGTVPRDIAVTLAAPVGRWRAVERLTPRWSTRWPPGRWQTGTPRSRWAIRKGAPVNISVASTQYVSVNVSALVAGAPYNPTGDVVKMAFPAPGVSPTVWYAGSWETANGAYNALCLVGPAPAAAVALGEGVYDVWVQVTDNPEIPALKAGTLTVGA